MPTYYPIDETAAHRSPIHVAGPTNLRGARAANDAAKKRVKPSSRANSSTGQMLHEESCSKEPVLFSYPQQSMCAHQKGH